jgi:hypothetical protein
MSTDASIAAEYRKFYTDKERRRRLRSAPTAVRAEWKRGSLLLAPSSWEAPLDRGPHAADGKNDAPPPPVLMTECAEEIADQPSRKEEEGEKE